MPTQQHLNACCQQRLIMMGHKDDSHKKRKKTHKQDMDKKHINKRQCLTGSPELLATPPVVSQTQDQEEAPV
jgi:hypothetical protein